MLWPNNALALVLLGFSATYLQAQDRRPVPADIPGLLAQFDSDERTARTDAFNRLLALGGPSVFRPEARIGRILADHPAYREPVTRALIKLLERENTVYRLYVAPDHDDWNYAYYGNLIGAVAALEDLRAAGALLHVMTSGNAAGDGLAALGRAALPGVLAKLDDYAWQVRAPAAMVLCKIAERRTTYPADRRLDENMFRTGVLTALRSEDDGVRRALLTCPASMPYPEVRRLVEQIARSDRNDELRVFAAEWLKRHERR